jgi:hypothetical protein
VIAPEFISYGLVVRAINRKVCRRKAFLLIKADAASRCGLIQALLL